MAYSIGIKIEPQQDPSKLKLIDTGTLDGETVTSRIVTITKSDLSFEAFVFATLDTEKIIGNYDKDYALHLSYDVVTNVSTYNKTYEFVILGYTDILKKNREFLLEVDDTIVDKQTFKKETLDINYYKMVAKDRCRFSDMVGAQKALDYIADMNLNIDFTLCGCQTNI